MEGTPHPCSQRTAVEPAYPMVKKKIFDTSSLIDKYKKVSDDNLRLTKKVTELTNLRQTLRADCLKYEQQLCNALQERESLNQRCATLQANSEQWEIQKRDLETMLESCKASLSQYKTLVQEGQGNVKPVKGPRGRPKKEDKSKVSGLEKQLRQSRRAIKQMQSKCKKALASAEMLATKVTKKDLLNKVDTTQLNRVVHILATVTSSPGEDDCGESDDGKWEEDADDSQLGHAAEYLEKLLVNGAEPSDSGGELCSVPSADDLSPKKESLKSDSRKSKESASSTTVSDPTSKQHKIGSPAKSEELGVAKFHDGTSKQSCEIENNGPTNTDRNPSELDANWTEQNESEMLSRMDDAPAVLEQQVSEAPQTKDVPEQQQQRIVEANLEASSTEKADKLDRVESESGLDVGKALEASVPLNFELDSELLPQADASEEIAETGEKIPGDQNKKNQETPQVECLDAHEPEAVVVATDREVSAVHGPLAEMGPPKIMPHQQAKESNARVAANAQSLAKDVAEDEESDMRILKAELSHMTREMCLKDSMLCPLSPLPPSPPPLIEEHSLGMFASENERGSENISFASVSRSIHSSTPNKKRKHRDQTLDFSNQSEEAVKATDARKQRRRFLHQESEGFEPHVGGTEDHQDSKEAGSISFDNLTSSNKKFSGKIWRNPIDRSFHLDAKLPEEFRNRLHVQPLVAFEVDLELLQCHVSITEVPLGGAQSVQNSSGAQDRNQPMFVDARVVPTAQQDQQFLRPLPVNPRPATTSYDLSGFRAPLPQRRTTVTPMSDLNPVRSCEAGLPFGSCSADVCSTSEETTDSLVPGILNESMSIAQRPLISPLPPSPQKPGGGEPSAAKRRFSRSRYLLKRQQPSVSELPPSTVQKLRPEKRRSSFGFRVTSSTTQRETEISADSRTMPDILEEEQGTEVPLGKKKRISLLSAKTSKTVPVPQATKTSAVSAVPEQDQEDPAQNVPEEGDSGSSVLTHRQRMRMLFASDSSSDDEEAEGSKTAPLVPEKEVARGPLSSADDPPNLLGQTKSVATTDDEAFVVPTVKRRRVSRLTSCNSHPASDTPKGPSLPSPDPPEHPGLDVSIEKSGLTIQKFSGIPYSIYVTTPDHHNICSSVRGNLTAAMIAKQALDKLSWLAAQPYVKPSAVFNIARGIRVGLEPVVFSTVVYLGNVKANPLLAYHRREQSVPLLTHMESLILDCFDHLQGRRANVANLFNALLSALRARLSSPRRPKTLLGQASCVRVVSAVCKRLGELSLARVFLWDLLRGFRGNAIFLMAAAIGVWPEILSSLRPDPQTEAVYLAYRYLLFHTPHTLNETLLLQVHTVLQEVGGIHPLKEGQTVTVVAETLFSSFKRAAEERADPENATRKKDLCLVHCLAFEEICKRSESWQWCLDVVLGRLVWPTLLEGITHKAEEKGIDLSLFLTWLLGDIWKHCPDESITTLRPFVEKLVESLGSDDLEFALQETMVRSLLKLPSLEQQEAVLSAVKEWQRRHRDTLVQIPHFAKARAKYQKSAKRAKKKKRKNRSAEQED